jgi:site-specific recombinase XerD
VCMKGFCFESEEKSVKEETERVTEHSIRSIRSDLRKFKEFIGPTPFEVLEKLKRKELLNIMRERALQGVHCEDAGNASMNLKEFRIQENTHGRSA